MKNMRLFHLKITKMKRLLVIGDLHFKVSNIKQCEAFEKKLNEQKWQPDGVVLLGDLLHDHEKIHVSPMNRVLGFIKKLPKPVYVIVGNHDMLNHQQIMTNNHWMNAMKPWKDVHIIDRVTKVDLGNDKNALMMPFVPNGKFNECVSKIEDWKSCDIIFAHQEFLGCKMGNKKARVLIRLFLK